MVKHIVMFKLKEKPFGENKMDVIYKIKEMLEKLPWKISVIKSYEVGVNLSVSPHAMDIVILSSFKNTNDLDIYRDHKEHIKVVTYIAEAVMESKVVDYEIIEEKE